MLDFYRFRTRVERSERDIKVGRAWLPSSLHFSKAGSVTRAILTFLSQHVDSMLIRRGGMQTGKRTHPARNLAFLHPRGGRRACGTKIRKEKCDNFRRAPLRFKAIIWDCRKDACTGKTSSRKIYLRHTGDLSVDSAGASLTLIDIYTSSGEKLNFTFVHSESQKEWK